MNRVRSRDEHEFTIPSNQMSQEETLDSDISSEDEWVPTRRLSLNTSFSQDSRQSSGDDDDYDDELVIKDGYTFHGTKKNQIFEYFPEKKLVQKQLPEYEFLNTSYVSTNGNTIKGKKKVYTQSLYDYTSQYPLWRFYLGSGFPIVFYGVGNKSLVLNHFINSLPNSSKLIYDGYSSKTAGQFRKDLDKIKPIIDNDIFSRSVPSLPPVVLIHRFDEWKDPDQFSNNLYQLMISIDSIHFNLVYDFSSYIKINLATYQPLDIEWNEVKDLSIEGIRNILISLNEMEQNLFFILMDHGTKPIGLQSLSNLCLAKEMRLMLDKNQIKKWLRVLVDHHLVTNKNDMVTLIVDPKYKQTLIDQNPKL